MLCPSTPPPALPQPQAIRIFMKSCFFFLSRFFGPYPPLSKTMLPACVHVLLSISFILKLCFQINCKVPSKINDIFVSNSLSLFYLCFGSPGKCNFRLHCSGNLRHLYRQYRVQTMRDC